MALLECFAIKTFCCEIATQRMSSGHRGDAMPSASWRLSLRGCSARQCDLDGTFLNTWILYLAEMKPLSSHVPVSRDALELPLARSLYSLAEIGSDAVPYFY